MRVRNEMLIKRRNGPNMISAIVIELNKKGKTSNPIPMAVVKIIDHVFGRSNPDKRTGKMRKIRILTSSAA